MLETLTSLRWQDIIDILLVAFLIYHVILLIRGTRAIQMVMGITVLIVVYFLARELEFMTLYWLLGTVLSSIFLIIIIIFQSDIRRALTQVGQTPFAKSLADSLFLLEEVTGAAVTMAASRTGALIVIERETGLKEYLDSGQAIDAMINRDLLISIFNPLAPLHDGGVIIRANRLSHAGCVMPLTKNPYISKQLGTRHRAAIGLSEETDAVVIVVSEETGHISLAQYGGITTNLDEAALRGRLRNIFAPKESHSIPWKSWLSRS